MKTIATFAAVAAMLASAPSFAEDAKPDARVESAPVATPDARRLTTVERWRGAPYTRSASHSDALLRQEALDKALPAVATAPNFATMPSF